MPELEEDFKSIEIKSNELFEDDKFQNVNQIPDIIINKENKISDLQISYLIAFVNCDFQKVNSILSKNSSLVNMKSPIDGNTALHYACKFGDIILIRALVGNYKAEVNAINQSGKTPLHYAVEFSKDEVVSLLVNHYGAKKDIRDYNGKLPIDWVKKDKLEVMEKILGKVYYRSIVKEEKVHSRKISSKIKTLGSMLSHDNSRKNFMSFLKGTNSFSSRHRNVSLPPSVGTFGSRNFLSLPNTRNNKPKIRKALSPRGDKSPYKDGTGQRGSFSSKIGFN